MCPYVSIYLIARERMVFFFLFHVFFLLFKCTCESHRQLANINQNTYPRNDYEAKNQKRFSRAFYFSIIQAVIISKVNLYLFQKNDFVQHQLFEANGGPLVSFDSYAIYSVL